MSRNISLVVLPCIALLFAAWACDDGPTSTPPDPGSHSEPSGGSISVSDNGSSITVINETFEALTARISFVIPGEEEGWVNVCNPYAEPGNRSAIPPEAPFSEYDQPLPPGGSLTVGTEVCGPYVGYSVTVRNADGEIVFEEYK